MSELPPFGRFPGIAADQLTADQARLVDAFTGRRGLVPEPYRIWIGSAPLAERLKSLSDHLLRGDLSSREREIAILVTAHRLSATYVEAAHRRLGAEAGLPAEAIDAICRGERPTLDDRRERSVYEAACAMHDGKALTPERFDSAVSALGHDGLAELSALLGFYCACAFILNFYDVASGR